jgi:hypothetical protein
MREKLEIPARRSGALYGLRACEDLEPKTAGFNDHHVLPF